METHGSRSSCTNQVVFLTVSATKPPDPGIARSPGSLINFRPVTRSAAATGLANQLLDPTVMEQSPAPAQQPSLVHVLRSIGLATWLLCFAMLADQTSAQSAPTEFLEQFAFATDPAERERALDQLIPGTEDSYFYRALHHQHVGELSAVEPLLKTWSERYGRTHRLVEIEHRQALLQFGENPAETYAYLRRTLGLSFDASRERPAGEPSALPTRLPSDFLSPTRLDETAKKRHPKSLKGFHKSALRRLAASGNLDATTLRDLLRRLRRADVPNLVTLVARDLKSKNSSGFGSHPVHAKMFLSQLDELANQMESVRNDTDFIQAYLARLAPSADVAVERNPAAFEAWLDRLYAFAQTLPPAQNSLKANILFRRLEHDLALGKPSRARFEAYLQLPRKNNQRNSTFLRNVPRDEFVETGKKLVPNLSVLGGDDESLIERYLEHFFASTDSIEPFDRYLRKEFLERTLAETKILAGDDNTERWYSMLGNPSYYERLERRVDLRFAHDQKRRFGLDEPVRIGLDVKNVDTLLVKIFEIDSYAYHRDLLGEPSVGIDLDGLVAGQETTYTYDTPALRRVRRTYNFPSIRGPGCWVVEFLGNGISSRALIQKGHLQAVTRTTAAGHVVTVLDQDGNLVTDALALLDNREYQADETGEIVIPFTSSSDRKTLVLKHGKLSSLASFYHQQESYRLELGTFVPRESLIAGGVAEVLVRATLTIGTTPVPIELLEDAVLEVTSINQDGVRSVQAVRNLELQDDAELTHEIRVPDRCRSLEFSLTGKVRRVRDGEQESVRADDTNYDINAIDTTAETSSALLSQTEAGGDYVVEILGRSGEPKAGSPVRFTMEHRDYRQPIQALLQTDADGRVVLGPLPGIRKITTDAIQNGSFNQWNLEQEAQTYPPQLHGAAGSPLSIPWIERDLDPNTVSLIEYRSRQPYRNAFANLTLEGGLLKLQGLEPGDYELRLHRDGRKIQVRLTDGEDRVDSSLVTGSDRLLVKNSIENELQVAAIEDAGDEVVIRVVGATAETRLHVYTTRYLAAFDSFGRLHTDGGAAWHEPIDLERARQSEFHAGRSIGDEHRYILDRRFARKFAGNMLQRPGLLLNPWELEESSSSWNSSVGLGGGAGGASGGRGGAAPAPSSASERAGLSPSAYANLDFMPRQAKLLTNLRPDADGIVRIPSKQLGESYRHLVHVVAIDGARAVLRTEQRKPAALTPRSRQLMAGLDPKTKLTENKGIEFIPAGTPVVFDDPSRAEWKAYDSLESVFTLFTAIDGSDDEFAKFSFLYRWAELSDLEKRTLYSEHACHELHYFIFRKDEAFFEAVVRPYIANKTHKKFVDEWLLEMDMARYLEPWAFGQLNVFEKILLAQRLDDGTRASATARQIRELLDLTPANMLLLDGLVTTALESGSLDYRGPGDSLPLAGGPSSPGSRVSGLSLANGPTTGGGGGAGGRLVAGLELEEAEEAPSEMAMDAEDSMPMAKKVSSRAGRSISRQRELARRESATQLYRAADQTRDLVESDYWRTAITDADAYLIETGEFWFDLARAKKGEPFCSPNFPSVGGDSTSAKLLALAVLDLPFRSATDGITSSQNGAKFEMRSTYPMLLARKELRAAEAADPSTGRILISQNFFRLDDRYAYEGNQQRDKFVRDEFVADIAYGCQVVLTNPTSSARRFELLTQIPTGSSPLAGGSYTDGKSLSLAPFSTSTVEFSFYFPRSGNFGCYPAHISEDGRSVASAEDVVAAMQVVDTPTKIDTKSWQHVSQNGDAKEVLDYLDTHSLARIELSKLAFRLKDKAFYEALKARLQDRLHFDQTVWSYGLMHQDTAATRTYLEHRSDFVARCGMVLTSDLLDVDPIERHAYQHMEFDPLFHARVHKFGDGGILNPSVFKQYGQFLRMMAYQPRLDATDLMTATYYLLLEDRVEEAMKTFARVDTNKLSSKLQHDYMAAYMTFFEVDGDRALARRLAEKHQNHPVDRWRAMFQNVLAQLDEIEGATPTLIGDGTDRTGSQTVLADNSPALEMDVEARTVTLRHANLEDVKVRYYAMDAELSFSKTPFVQGNTSRSSGGRGPSDAFGYVMPNRSDTVTLRGTQTTFALPAEFANQNVLVEVVGAGGLRRRQTYIATSLSVRMIENYGQLVVTDAKDGGALAKTYVKVYARMPNGDVKFHKDGYTDLRGRFDYASLSATHTRFAERFAILVLSDDRGAVIREVAPPAQ